MWKYAIGSALGLVLSLANVTPAHASNILVNHASPFFHGGGTMFCASVAGGTMSNGTQIIIWPCLLNDPSQKWSEVTSSPPGAPFFSLRSDKNTNMCIGVAAGSVNNGAQMVLWSFSNPIQGNQFWRKDPGPHSGCFIYTNLGSGKVMGVSGGTMTQGQAVIQWQAFNPLHDDQEWCPM